MLILDYHEIYLKSKKEIQVALVLASLAMKLMHIPALSAAAEHNWSHFRFIYNLCKNRLINECVFKLISIYFNLHLISNSNKNRQNNNIQI